MLLRLNSVIFDKIFEPGPLFGMVDNDGFRNSRGGEVSWLVSCYTKLRMDAGMLL